MVLGVSLGWMKHTHYNERLQSDKSNVLTIVRAMGLKAAIRGAACKCAKERSVKAEREA